MEEFLVGPAAGLHLTMYEEVTSTNAILQERAAQGAPEGEVALAWSQSAGRGRRGRSFYSPPGTGLYLSILLRPQNLPPTETVLLTAAAAVAVALSVEEVAGIPAQIKWVNDVWVAQKKVCGILAEGAFAPGGTELDYVVLGIGVNLIPPPGGFPPDLAPLVRAVFGSAKEAAEKRGLLAAGILNRFMSDYQHLSNRAFLTAYRSRSFLLGQEITVHQGGHSREAHAIALDDHCRLLVRYRDGSQEYLDSGEVSVRPMAR